MTNPAPSVEQPRSRLGTLTSIHGPSPLAMQRAAVVVFLSFVFFFGTLLIFYVRQQIGYFMLSTAFLVVSLFTMIGIWLQKRNFIYLHENGIRYKKKTMLWSDIKDIADKGSGGLEIVNGKGEKVTLPRSASGYEELSERIHAAVPAATRD
jgi:hypothetical protein